ncbi:MAG: bacterial regulatory s, tetR family protein [Nevskia sp.]|nr:bacterial regulatory s, tetR family protein [Nevskia sp.]
MSSTRSRVTSGNARARVPASKPVRGPHKRRTQAERTDEMRLRLVEAAALVLRRKGYAGLRTDEVSRAAKVSRGAQQHHFPTKDSLVLATAAHLLKAGLDRGLSRARSTDKSADPIEAIINDSTEFFLGPDFNVILDLVLAGSKDRDLRDQVYAQTRTSRLAVEEAWLAVLCDSGLSRADAETALWLTLSIVRGFAVRALWQRDEQLFRTLLDQWKLILAGHLKNLKGTKR